MAIHFRQRFLRSSAMASGGLFFWNSQSAMAFCSRPLEAKRSPVNANGG